MMPAAAIMAAAREPSGLRAGYAYGLIGDRGLPSWKELEIILSHPEGLLHAGVWLVILRLAADGRAPGFLLDPTGVPLNAAGVARLAKSSQPHVTEAIGRLIELGAVELARGYHALLSVGEFIHAMCEVGDGFWIGRRELHAMYRRWRNGADELKLGRSEFVRVIAALGFQASRSRRSSGVQFSSWEGLQARSTSLVK